jgi:DNA-binding NarL/FixJ family response regulator
MATIPKGWRVEGIRPHRCHGLGRTVRAELRVAGERTRVEADSRAAQEILSTLHLRIARLAPQGCRSGRSGERLFLSPRTVDSRLCRISPKLSITSRSELSSRIDVN